MKTTAMLWFGIEPSYYFLCGAGALVLFFKMQSGRSKPVISILGYIHPPLVDNPLGRVLEAILFALLGALLGTLIAQPINPQQAIVAGLGWTGLIGSFSK